MAFPGFPLATNRTNSTPMSDVHPADHNDVNAAANDLQGQIDAINANLSGFIPGSTFDAKGDLLAATGDNTYTRQPISNDGHVLTGDSTSGTGMSWKGGSTLLVGEPTGVGTTALNFVNIPQYCRNLVLVGRPRHNNGSTANTSRELGIVFNSDTSAAAYNSVRIFNDVRTNIDGTTNGRAGFIGDNFGGCIEIIIPVYNSNLTTHRAFARGWAVSASNLAADFGHFETVAFYTGPAAPITRIDLFIIVGAGDGWADNEVQLYGLS